MSIAQFLLLIFKWHIAQLCIVPSQCKVPDCSYESRVRLLRARAKFGDPGVRESLGQHMLDSSRCKINRFLVLKGLLQPAENEPCGSASILRLILEGFAKFT